MAERPRRDLTKSNTPFQRAVQRLPLGRSSAIRYRGDGRGEAAVIRGMQVGGDLLETPASRTLAGHDTALMQGISVIAHGKVLCWIGHPSMFGQFCAEKATDNCRDCRAPDGGFYDQKAYDLRVIVEPDSVLCGAHRLDAACLKDALQALETSVVLTLEALA